MGRPKKNVETKEDEGKQEFSLSDKDIERIASVVVDKLHEKKHPGTEAKTTQPTPSQGSRFPIPTDYRNLVDTVLNKEFNIDINYLPDAASFEFSVLVPQKYSNVGKPHWDTYGEDRRTKVIMNALGINGVREWATTVYNNFNPETQSRITFDRSQP